MKKTKTMIFGTFDGIHPGHLSLIEQAREESDELIAVLSRDETVEKLKGRVPKKSFNQRKKLLEETELIYKVVKGDKELGTYQSVEKVNPAHPGTRS